MKKLVSAISLLFLLFTVCIVGGTEQKMVNKKLSKKEVMTNSIGMKFVEVPAGSFLMGKPSCQEPEDPFASRTAYNNCLKECCNSEKPAHQVTISEAYWIGQFEVTQEQWYKVMGSNPAEFKTDKVGEESRNYPVENVSWNDVQIFISRLNAKEGKQYRLPTEAEWEYACKSGGKDQKYCGGNELSDFAWHIGNSGNHTHRVGTKKPNGLGIYDMTGNVSEWVSDWYDESYYSSSVASSPQGPLRGEFRVNRGGSWNRHASYALSFSRSSSIPDIFYNDIGFRLVLTQFSK